MFCPIYRLKIRLIYKSVSNIPYVFKYIYATRVILIYVFRFIYFRMKIPSVYI